MSRKLPFEIADGRYRCETEIGRGGMGTVYKAVQTDLNRAVAVKILNEDLASDDEFRQRFDQEAKIVAQLTHPNIVSIIDRVLFEHTYCIVMEFVDGFSLQKMIEQSAPLSDAQVAMIGAQVARALKSAHDKGIVHRDVKPDNLLITKDGLVKITDFGIARLDNSTLKTQTGVSLGTPKFMSPEQVIGRGIDAQSDLYALGVCLYYALTGHTPYDGDNPIAIATKHLYDKPEPISVKNPTCSAALIDVVMTAMAKQKPERYQDGEEMAQALEACASGQSGTQAFIHTATKSAIRTGGETDKLRRSAAAGVAHSEATTIITPNGKNRRTTTVQTRKTMGALWPTAVAVMIVTGIVGASLMLQKSGVGPDGMNPPTMAISGRDMPNTISNGTLRDATYPEKLLIEYAELIKTVEQLSRSGDIVVARQTLDDFRLKHPEFRSFDVDQRIDLLTAQLPLALPDVQKLVAKRREDKSKVYIGGTPANLHVALAYATAARDMLKGLGTYDREADLASLEAQVKALPAVALPDDDRTTMTEKLAENRAEMEGDPAYIPLKDIESLYLQMIAAEPTNYGWWLEMAQVYRRLGFTDDARVLLQYVERQAPVSSNERKLAGQQNRSLETQTVPVP